MGRSAVFAARWCETDGNRKSGKVEGMTTLYDISYWGSHYENNRTREMKKMGWVPIPTKFDGDGYTELVDRENGPALYGCWVACVLVAAKCETRGSLMRDNGQPHTPQSLARITRLDGSLMRDMLDICVSIGWLKTCEIPQEGAVIPHPTDYGKERKGKERNRRERKGKERNTLSSKLDAGGDVGAVIDHYRKHHPRSKPDAKARKAIESRFRDGFAVSDLCEAIDGMHKTPHNMGENERGAKYLGLELCMRTSDQVQRFIENCHDPPRAVSEKFLKGERAGSEFLKLTGGIDAE